MINENADMKCSIFVTQRQIDIEAVIKFMFNDRLIKVKLPNIAENGFLLRLKGECENGGDLYVEINIKKTNKSKIGEFLRNLF